MDNVKKIQLFLFKYVGTYSKCVLYIDINFDDIKFTDDEINSILAKKNNWEYSQHTYCAMAKAMSLHKQIAPFDNQIADIAVIMMTIQYMNDFARGKYIPLEKCYKHAIKIYSNMLPFDNVMYKTIVEFKRSTSVNTKVEIVAFLSILFLILLLLLFASLLILCRFN